MAITLSVELCLFCGVISLANVRRCRLADGSASERPLACGFREPILVETNPSWLAASPLFSQPMLTQSKPFYVTPTAHLKPPPFFFYF